jgi:hypothetical protein
MADKRLTILDQREAKLTSLEKDISRREEKVREYEVWIGGRPVAG